MSDSPLTECQECKGELKKLISAPAFQFKGSGWYVTDYGKGGNDGAKASGGGEGKTEGGTSSSSSTKSEGASGGSESKAKATKSEAPKASAGAAKD